MCKVLWAVDGSFVSYKGIQGAFEDTLVNGQANRDRVGR
jgi:hypothetical protein